MATSDAIITGEVHRFGLTRLDRCDGCGAAAQFRALLPAGGELLFCSHHARKHGDRLLEIGAEMTFGP